jgi:hypothetical protein
MDGAPVRWGFTTALAAVTDPSGGASLAAAAHAATLASRLLGGSTAGGVGAGGGGSALVDVLEAGEESGGAGAARAGWTPSWLQVTAEQRLRERHRQGLLQGELLQGQPHALQDAGDHGHDHDHDDPHLHLHRPATARHPHSDGASLPAGPACGGVPAPPSASSDSGGAGPHPAPHTEVWEGPSPPTPAAAGAAAAAAGHFYFSAAQRIAEALKVRGHHANRAGVVRRPRRNSGGSGSGSGSGGGGAGGGGGGGDDDSDGGVTRLRPGSGDARRRAGALSLGGVSLTGVPLVSHASTRPAFREAGDVHGATSDDERDAGEGAHPGAASTHSAQWTRRDRGASLSQRRLSLSLGFWQPLGVRAGWRVGRVAAFSRGARRRDGGWWWWWWWWWWWGSAFCDAMNMVMVGGWVSECG